MVAVPGSVYLTRGNHECAVMNERPRKSGGGFYEELRAKYRRFRFLSSFLTTVCIIYTLTRGRGRDLH